LPDNIRGKIDLVMWGANAGTELNDEIGGARTKLRGHRSDRVRDNAELGALFAGMHETNRAANRINEKNRTAISNVNAEADAALTGNQSVAVLETFVSANCRIDQGDIFSMDLPRGHERQISEPVSAADFSMHCIQAREGFRLVVRELDARDTQRETMNDLGQRIQRRELFSRKLTFVHLPDVVVRVVRVVVVTGGRLPA
jgi:hypothetical protein